MLVFLGIHLDTMAMECMRLSDAKLAELCQIVINWSSKHAGKRVNSSPSRKLSHAAKIMVPGRIFFCRMIDTANRAKQLDHWIHLIADFKFNLAWWHTFLEFWNGKSSHDAGSHTYTAPSFHNHYRCFR